MLYLLVMGKEEDICWHKIASGDAAAWENIVRKYQSLVYTVALRSGLSRADAADCFQHTWLALWENRQRIANPSRISAWLTTTAKREALRLLRLRTLNGQQRVGDHHVDGNPLPDEEILSLERLAHLEIGMQQLGPQCRKLMELMFFEPEETTYKEIAEKLGVAVNSLGPLRKRCMENLKKILIRNGFL